MRLECLTSQINKRRFLTVPLGTTRTHMTHTPTPAEQLAELQRAWEANELSFAEWFRRFEDITALAKVTP